MKIIRFKINTLDIEVPKNIMKLTKWFFVEEELYSFSTLMEEYVYINDNMEVISVNVTELTWKNKWSFLEKYSV